MEKLSDIYSRKDRQEHTKKGEHMKINFNMPALIANSSLKNTETALSRSVERLSSGLKINKAKDNASGVAIAKRMNAQLKGIASASQNASDGVSIIEAADGTLSEIQAMVQRITELSARATGDNFNDSERTTLQEEINQLKEEITSIVDRSDFNGQGILDGSFDAKGYSETAGVKLGSFSEEVAVGKYELTITAPATFDADGKILTNAEVSLGTNFPSGATYVSDGNNVYIKAAGGFEMRIDLDKTVTAGTIATVEATDIGPMRLQIGANEGQVLELRIPKVSIESMQLQNIDVTTKEGAEAGVKLAEKANEFVSSVRAKLGAYQNRLEHTVNSLEVSDTNLTAAYSRIMDTDMAAEMTEYAKYQVMAQAATSMLAQANERPQQILQLLQ